MKTSPATTEELIVRKLTEKEIVGALVHNGYSEKTAFDRTPLILKFFEVAGLESRLTTHPSPSPRQIEFFTGDTTCTIDNADIVTFEIAHPPKTEWLGGTWMDTAPLTYLARVCDIGHRLLGENWMLPFRERLANRMDLLNVLNEVWWLGCWGNISQITSSPKGDAGGDNDWSLVLDEGLSIKMQVKRRRNDLLRGVHPTRAPYGLFDKVSKRFSRSGKDQLNVGAITIYAGVTNAVLRAVDDYFRSNASGNVVAIILWCPFNPPYAPTLQSYFIRDRKSEGRLKRALAVDALDTLYRTNTIFPISIAEATCGMESTKLG